MPQPSLQQLCDESPFHRALGVNIEPSEEGVLLQVSLGSAQAVDSAGSTVHGGILASLLDSAATFALIASTGHDWVTVDLRVDYLRPTPLGAVTVRGEVIRAGKTLGRSRAELLDGAGRLCGICVGTFTPVRPAENRP